MSEHFRAFAADAPLPALAVAAGAALIAVLTASPSAGSVPAPGSSEWTRLMQGEILLDERDQDRRRANTGVPMASVSMLVHAPVERVWAVIISCEHARRFVAGLRACEILEERGEYARTRQVVDKGWTTPRLEYTFETYRTPYRSMRFELVEGNLSELKGAWIFEPLDAGLLVRHDLTLEPRVPVPRWLVRRNILEDLPGMMRCIRALAGGSGNDQQARTDRAYCASRSGE